MNEWVWVQEEGINYCQCFMVLQVLCYCYKMYYIVFGRENEYFFVFVNEDLFLELCYFIIVFICFIVRMYCCGW